MLNGCVRVPNQNYCNTYGRMTFPIYIAVFAFILMWSPDLTVEGIPSRHEQCRNRGFDFACELDRYDYHCEVLSCGRGATNPILYKLIPRWGVMDGTPCGTSKVCKNKKCVVDEDATRQCPEENHFERCKQKRFRAGERIQTRSEQCKDHGFDVACKSLISSDCRHLSCGYSMLDGKYVQRPVRKQPCTVAPTPGTRCITGVCYNNKCIPVRKWPRSLGNLTYTGEDTFLQCDLDKS